MPGWTAARGAERSLAVDPAAQPSLRPYPPPFDVQLRRHPLVVLQDAILVQVGGCKHSAHLVEGGRPAGAAAHNLHTRVELDQVNNAVLVPVNILAAWVQGKQVRGGGSPRASCWQAGAAMAPGKPAGCARVGPASRAQALGVLQELLARELDCRHG
eukprot:scaffold32902_cov101-Isochrysis_galbana.AAC.2